MIKEINRRSINLFRTIYKNGTYFQRAYDAIVASVLESALTKSNVVYAVPGNPVFYAFPVQEMLRKAKERGLKVVVVSGVSSFDMPLAELRLEVGFEGVQLYNALLLESIKPALNIRAHNFIFQIGVLGLKEINQRRGRPAKELTRVTSYLLRFYRKDHPCYAMMLHQEPHKSCEIIESVIGSIPNLAEHLMIGHTLYIPAMVSQK